MSESHHHQLVNIPNKQIAAIINAHCKEPEFELVNNFPVQHNLDSNSVLVRAEYASVNPGDCVIRDGSVPWITHFPHVLGFDGTFCDSHL